MEKVVIYDNNEGFLHLIHDGPVLKTALEELCDIMGDIAGDWNEDYSAYRVPADLAEKLLAVWENRITDEDERDEIMNRLTNGDFEITE